MHTGKSNKKVGYYIDHTCGPCYLINATNDNAITTREMIKWLAGKRPI